MEILELYHSNLLSLEDAIKQLNEKNNTNNKKNEGVFYTPLYIIDQIIKNLDYSPELTILEPSVGHGMFVFRLIEYVEKNYNLKNEELKEWFEKKVFCFDINAENIHDFKKLLIIFFGKRNIKNVDLKNIEIADTLFHQFNQKFDVSFGNPPYIRAKNLDENYMKKLKNEYSSCKSGNIDIYYAFMELMHHISDVSSFIVPNSYIANVSAKRLREKINERITHIINFKHNLIFKDARTYTSIYKIGKEKTEFIKYKNEINDSWEIINKENLNNELWILDNPNIDNDELTIGKMFNVYSGIETLNNKNYIIDMNKQENNCDYYIKEYKGEKYHIEKDICKRLYKMTKLNENNKILFPYDENFKVVKEEVMRKKYIKTYEYFKSIRKDLDFRDKGKTEKYDSWYAYGRKQGMNDLKEDYFIFIPKMMNNKTKCKIVKKEEYFLISSGFAIGLNDETEAIKIKSIIDDKFFDYISIYGKVWAGKTPYYSFSKKILMNFKI